ncbi:MAG: nucleotidyltransferase domain-containing protein [Paludibacteraceae bacterium]|nr:nucleotidyltransferase domain-containing protein [Paludibacteraceae bacterium]
MINPEKYFEQRYETKRFLPSSEAVGEMKEIRDQLREAQARNPAIKGIGFFGSITMGTENENSDIDVVFFYNSDVARKNNLAVDSKTLLKNFRFQGNRISTKEV